MDDLISRQAAIDRLTEYGNGRAVFISVGEAIIRIEQLPPAQPEIIRCKDCKHFDPIYTDGEGVCGHWNAKTENNAYCSYAERRTDV